MNKYDRLVVTVSIIRRSLSNISSITVSKEKVCSVRIRRSEPKATSCCQIHPRGPSHLGPKALLQTWNQQNSSRIQEEPRKNPGRTQEEPWQNPGRTSVP